MEDYTQLFILISYSLQIGVDLNTLTTKATQTVNCGSCSVVMSNKLY